MRRQRGVALITVLLVVAIVTVVCAGLIAREQLSIRSSANLLSVRQAWQYAQGGELLAKSILQRDLRQGDPRQPVDYLGEAWARPLATFPLDGGELRLRIEDLSGRFNLNSLVQQRQVNQQAVARFRRLLLLLEIERPYAERLQDWLDQNQEPSGENGAEDNQYLLLQPPYRAANRPLMDVSELRLLVDMNEADFLRLQPYVSALPDDAKLNVNTASAMVLASLANGVSLGMAESLVAARGREGFRNIDEFLGQPALAGVGLTGQGLAVGSQYFQVISEVSIDEHRQVLVSRIKRSSDGRMRVLARDLGQSGLPVKPVEEEKK
ncbi:type II secretion system minor pseudopilin GspK [Pseudomonas sp. LS44]|uniref:type II secretion system minor pseudopilin GspK n=1 Tax=Pseudomonas sp. LS44 TaxID=1357074 RepID=UPI00215B33BC|nr:type II secretion system minor pseudopilin GspK [Pseudomonas sp. LS44]UVE19083.1 type II secretion system minor pseudopilin GspK [Pseudomonas sp. LS44]